MTLVDSRLEEAARSERLSRSRLLEAIESMSDGFALYDTDDRLVVCNSRFRQRMFPARREVRSLQGISFADITRGAATAGLIRDAIGRIDDWVAERLAQHRDPQGPQVQQWTDGRWIQLNERRNEGLGTVTVYTDISELKQKEMELERAAVEAEQARGAAEEANRTKSAFLANMSHELRTPLNAIIGYSEMLEEEAQDLGQDNFVPDLNKIQGAGKHLLALINDILDLSKIEAGKMELHFENVDLATIVQEVVSMITPLIEKNGNALALRCADDLGSMRADLTKLRQVLFNLLSNASKFTSHGTVTLGANRERVDGVRLDAVLDHGYRHRDDARADGEALPGLLASRCFHLAEVWWDGARAPHQSPVLPDDGGRCDGRERAGRGVHLHRPAADRWRGAENRTMPQAERALAGDLAPPRACRPYWSSMTTRWRMS